MLSHEFDLAPSRYYFILLTLMPASTMIILLTLTIGVWVKFAMLLGVGVHGGYCLWRDGLRQGRGAIVRIVYTKTGGWLVQTREGVVEAVVDGSSTVTKVVSVLRFKLPGRKRLKSCLIFCDSLTSEQYRQLRVILRMF